MFSKSDADEIVGYLKDAPKNAVILLTGAQGSGKTYIAKEIKKYRSDLIIYSKSYLNSNARISVYRVFGSIEIFKQQEGWQRWVLEPDEPNMDRLTDRLTAKRILSGWCMCGDDPGHHPSWPSQQPGQAGACDLGCADRGLCRAPTQEELALARKVLETPCAVDAVDGHPVPEWVTRQGQALNFCLRLVPSNVRDKANAILEGRRLPYVDSMELLEMLVRLAQERGINLEAVRVSDNIHFNMEELLIVIEYDMHILP